ncbi:MAG TPA: hypothetical protein VGG23_05960 [Acidimicrobiales bacterium]|jgi:hypothetical protein
MVFYGVAANLQPLPFQKPARPLPGAGTVAAVQVRPFHEVAAARPVCPPASKSASPKPTATQLLADRQDTATRYGLRVPLG